MKTTVIFHNADFDGIFCREIARRALPGAELIGWNYGDEKLPFPSEGTVAYVLDLSPSVFEDDGINHIDLSNGRVIWIDHHRTAMQEWSEKLPGYRIEGVAACRLAWQWFSIRAMQGNPDHFTGVGLAEKHHYVDRTVHEPLAVRLAGEYDVFDKRDPMAERFQFGLKSEDVDYQLLLDSELNNESGSYIARLLDQGKCLQYARENEYCDVITSQGIRVGFEGINFLACCSHEADIRSQLFEAAIGPNDQALMGFTILGSRWRFSLYGAPSRPDLDLSVIAKKYGGGGHKQACGFIVDGEVGMKIIGGKL